jgi:hypothetical protein
MISRSRGVGKLGENWLWGGLGKWQICRGLYLAAFARLWGWPLGLLGKHGGGSNRDPAGVPVGQLVGAVLLVAGVGGLSLVGHCRVESVVISCEKEKIFLEESEL